MPSRMARATSCAWVPSWRSRSIRRRVAAEASTVWARACSSERTRADTASGPSNARMKNWSITRIARIPHGAARRRITPPKKTATAWEEPAALVPDSGREELGQPVLAGRDAP